MANPLKTTNIDSGTRWIQNNVAGKPLYSWDSRNHKTKHTYDALQRPTLVTLTLSDLSVLVVEKTEYGTDPTKNNIGQVFEQYDQSGKTEIESYDFKGNPLKTIKQFCEDYQNTIDWEATPAPTLKTETFIQQITYDALNRPLTQTQPDNTVIEYTYNEAGLLETVKKDAETFVSNINYNEKGQRTDIYYGNGSKTRYYYNPLNFRLTRMLTTRNTGSDILQDISYIYDPVGNIVEINDVAQQTHYFSNTVIAPKGQYEYDALYRLKKATGRELTSLQLPTHTDFVNNIAVPNTATNAMQNYIQEFTYDELGNILQMKSVGKWTRDYFYNTNDNKLLGHTENTNDYTYDAHGNITSMPHLTQMNWDYKNQLLGAANGTFDSYYVYDASGNRVRKVVVKGNITEERYYLGNYEVFRKTTNGTLNIERETIFVSDDTKKIAQIDNDGTTETIRYQYDNHLGSASLELDETAAIIFYEEYHPFGTTSYRSGRTETETSQKRYKYVGKERDEETGLYYYGARYYAPWIARFISTDPMKAERTWLTPYNYVQNNPINRTDPTGALDGDPQVNNVSINSNTWGGLLVGGDTSQALIDIQSAVSEEYRDKVSIIDGKIHFDMTEKDVLVSGDLGVETLFAMVNSDNQYFYGVDENNTVETWRKDLDSGNYQEKHAPLKLTEYLTLDGGKGVSGGTMGGVWNVWNIKKVIEVDKINRKGVKKGTKRVTKPFQLEQGSRSLRYGINNERVIAPLGKIFEIGEDSIPRPAVVLHELREMFYQTEKGMYRDEAHVKTIQDVRKRIPSNDKRYDNVHKI